MALSNGFLKDEARILLNLCMQLNGTGAEESLPEPPDGQSQRLKSDAVLVQGFQSLNQLLEGSSGRHVSSLQGIPFHRWRLTPSTRDGHAGSRSPSR